MPIILAIILLFAMPAHAGNLSYTTIGAKKEAPIYDTDKELGRVWNKYENMKASAPIANTPTMQSASNPDVQDAPAQTAPTGIAAIINNSMEKKRSGSLMKNVQVTPSR